MTSRNVLLAVVAVLLVVLAVTRTRTPPPPETASEPAPVAAAPKKARKPKPADPGALGKPAPKPCLATPEVEGEADVAASTGLAYEDARDALNAFAPNLASCVGSEENPTGALRLRITVACTGVVQAATVADRGDWSEATAACVTDRLAYAEFPAHGLPDGDVVEWPLRYAAP